MDHVTVSFDITKIPPPRATNSFPYCNLKYPAFTCFFRSLTILKAKNRSDATYWMTNGGALFYKNKTSEFLHSFFLFSSKEK